MADHAQRRRGQSARHGRDERIQIAEIPVLAPPEPAPDAAALEAGRLLFAHECRFVMAAALEAQLPPDTLPEVAFLGRSNVGKSSLVNAVTGRNALARVSHTPGRTREIIFFELPRLMLADLPGYGFASAPKGEIARWSRLVPQYAKGRASLKRALLLIDARHGFMKADREFMAMLDGAAVSYQIVLTKCDKPPRAELAKRIADMAAELKTHTAAHPQMHLTSAHAGTGIAELRATLAALAG